MSDGPYFISNDGTYGNPIKRRNPDGSLTAIGGRCASAKYKERMCEMLNEAYEYGATEAMHRYETLEMFKKART